MKTSDAESKLCPFLSYEDFIYCKREDCMAWRSGERWSTELGRCVTDTESGYCKLVERE